MTEQTRLVVVTGMSGAGKSTALHALEDLGYFCVDNTPPPVVSATVEALEAARVRRIALGVDVRVQGFVDVIGDVPLAVARADRDVSVLFLDAADGSLLRRFSATRRPHPLSQVVEPTLARAANAVLDGIAVEREKLAQLRARATHVVDTTGLSVHDLRRRVLEQFGASGGSGPRLRARLVSFGFKYGIPVDADLVFDVRFLKNPYFDESLREHTGLETPVRDYVLGDPEAHELEHRLLDLLAYCLPRFEREGKSYLTVGIGCTGGRHRSVVLADRIAGALRQQVTLPIDVVHRDVDRATLDRPSDVVGDVQRFEEGGREAPKK